MEGLPATKTFENTGLNLKPKPYTYAKPSTLNLNRKRFKKVHETSSQIKLKEK